MSWENAKRTIMILVYTTYSKKVRKINIKSYIPVILIVALALTIVLFSIPYMEKKLTAIISKILKYVYTKTD